MVKVAATGMFVAWLAHTSVDWVYDIPGLTGMAMVSAALLVLPARRQRAGVTRTRRGMALLAFGLVVLAALAGAVGRQYIAQHYQTSGAAQVARSPQQAITTLQKARSLDPYSLTTLYSLAAAYARLDDYADARRTLLAAAAREPSNYVPPALLGDLAVRRGDVAVARAAYARALALNPRDSMLEAAVTGVGGATTP
jgi:tetratricopeptide (TPR) repeat protein